MKKYFPQLPKSKSSLASHNQSNREENANQSEVSLHSSQMTSCQAKHKDKFRLTTSIDVVRLLINQGITFEGHDESKSSLDKGNFLEILSWYAKRCDNIHDFVSEHAHQKILMISPIIIEDIVTARKIETTKAIIEELNGDYFALLVDMSHMEQMTIVLRFVDRRGFVVERLIDIIHIQDTSFSSLKRTFVDLLAHHSLSLSYVRGQFYDGGSNMQDNIKGLKILIRQENRSAHSIHRFAHQLQQTLVAISKNCVQVGEIVLLVSNISNVLGASFTHMNGFQESQREKIQKALDMDELINGRSLLQELGLIKARDTCWGSSYKSFSNFIRLFGSIMDVLDAIVVDAHSIDERAKAMGYLRTCQTFEVAFMLHLMRDVLEITNGLNKSLQKKEHAIANAILFLEIAKTMLQKLRDNGWESLIDTVLAFCIKYDILILNFDEPYVDSGRSRCRPSDCNVLHHYRVKLFYKIID